LKIILVGPVYPWRGGIAHHSAMLAEHLKQRHQVEAITFSRQYPKIFFPGTSQYDTGGHPPSIPVHHWIDSINPFTWVGAAMKIRAMKPDLVMFAYSIPFFGPCYGMISALVRWKSNTKIAFLCHNVLPHEKRIGDRVLTKFAFSFSDYFFLHAKTLGHDLVALKPTAKFAVVPFPVYESFAPAMEKHRARTLLGITSSRVILYFGIVRPYKGVSILLEAMKYLDDVLLLLVGEFYDDEEKYRSQIQRLGLTNVKVVPEFVPNEKVGFYFSAADVVVLPYLSATQSGIGALAYHFEKPLIATDVGGLAEFAIDGKTGFLVPPNEPRALANAIRRFYQEKKEEEFIAQVKEEKKKHTWEHFVQTIEQLVTH
jgi:glycosyltransferase involved in cell wall biosynthesis